MGIRREGNTIYVDVTSVKFEDYDQIRNFAGEILQGGEDSLNIVLKETMTINSALIGYLIKLTRVDNVNLSMNVGNTKLYDMLSTLSLVDVLNITRVR